MIKKFMVLFISILWLSFVSVSADYSLFNYYNPEVFTVSKFFNVNPLKTVSLRDSLELSQALPKLFFTKPYETMLSFSAGPSKEVAGTSLELSEEIVQHVQRVKHVQEDISDQVIIEMELEVDAEKEIDAEKEVLVEPKSNHNSLVDRILITKKGFEPEEITIKVNQEIVWKNEQEKLDSLVVGLREISKMRSSFMRPGESFSWKFTQPGEYTYVDAVVIGRVGKVVVQ